jgi:penicillin-binding protein 2
VAQIRVDSMGNQVSDSAELRQERRAGYALRLTLDAKLQRAAEEALEYGINLAHQNKHWAANGGAIVAIDPRDGAVRAMASYPTYRPSVFVGRTDPKKLAPLLEQEAARRANYPGLNRAISGLYPPGSTWKPVTALAGMQEHVFSAYDSLQCTPVAYYGLDRQKFINWNPNVNRPMTLPEALAESCDTYFYEIGNRFYELGGEARVRMQQWAKGFGFGAPTGLDIAGEAEGLVPTPDWRWKTFESDWDKAWNPGDSIQLSIGQKDLLVTPLQMTSFYAMLANGGSVVTPHLVSAVEQPRAKGSPSVILRRFAPTPPKPTNLDNVALAAVRDGLYLATHSTTGTSSQVFANYSIPISGKTGTAEKVVPLPGYPSDHLEDQSWWCGWGPSNDARLVVCALIENGGHGSTAAAPAALRVFEKFFNRKAPPPILSDTD